MRHRAALIATAFVLGACTNTAGIDQIRQPGIIESRYLHVPVLTAPDSVTAGTPFNITVSTFGFSGCWTMDGTEVNTQAREALIQPYDLVREGERVACLQMPVILPRTVQLRFDEPGTATIVVQGVRNDGDQSQPTQIERTIVVR
jgi:hypothetical protein